MFADKSGLDNSGKHFRRVRRPLGTRFDQQYSFRHQNATLARVNFFSYLSKYGVGELIYYKTMNQETYCRCNTAIIRDLRQKFDAHSKIALRRYVAEFLQTAVTSAAMLSYPSSSQNIIIITVSIIVIIVVKIKSQ